MINVTSNFFNVWKNKRNFEYSITITFTDGTVESLTNTQITLSNGSIEFDTGSSSFPLGCVFAKTFNINLSNTQDEWSKYDFMGAKFKVTCKLPDVPEDVIDFGTFTVIEPENYGATISIKAIDDMYMADRVYVPTIEFPANAEDVFIDICLHGLNGSVLFNYVTSNFPNNTYSCNKPDENATCREVLGYIAMLSGGNIGLNKDGKVKFYLYDKELNSKLGDVVNGGRFDNVESSGAYVSGDSVNGGEFDNPENLTVPYATGDNLDGGTFTEWNYYHDFNYALDVTIETDDVVITGVRTVIDNTEYLAGTDVYALEVENPLFKDYQAGVNAIFSVLGGLKFRPYTMEHICYPIAEIGDSCYIKDRKGNTYVSFITSVDFALKGKTSFTCTADSPVRNSSTYANASVKAYQKAHEEILVEKNTREQAIEDMAEQIENSSGFYETEVTDETTGAITRYMHNKPTLADSDIRWKYTSETISVSTDYGKTWNASINVDGDSIVNKLYAKTLIGTSIQNDTGTFKVNTDGTIYGASVYSNPVGDSNPHASIDKDGIEFKNKYGNIKFDGTGDDPVFYIDHRDAYGNRTCHGNITAGSGGVQVEADSYNPEMNNTIQLRINQYGQGGFLLNKLYGGYNYGSFVVDNVSRIDMSAAETYLTGNGYLWLNRLDHPSDRRLKDNIADISEEKAKDFIYGLKAKTFKYVNDDKRKTHHGFIAQEVETLVTPEWDVVNTSPKTGMMGISYLEVIPDMVAVIQSQHKEIEELKKRIEDLEGK